MPTGRSVSQVTELLYRLLYPQFMPAGLERRYGTRSSHFVTCSCYHRLPLLADDRVKRLLLNILEEVRQKYRFCVYGYVIMPEHFHLLMGAPESGDPSTALQVLKQRVARKVRTVCMPTLSQHMGKVGAPSGLERFGLYEDLPQFWQRRFYDFNVWSGKKHVEKLRYMHRNPVTRGLVKNPEDWTWSSFRHYAFGEAGPVEIESEWTGRRREREIHVLVLPG